MDINISKYENAILFLCDKLGGSVNGETKLYKLLYYIDFDRYELNESLQTVTGDKFKHRKNGPVPATCRKIIDGMIHDRKLTKEERDIGAKHNVKVFTALQPPDTSVFNPGDLFILNYVVAKYGNLTGSDLARLTHVETPYTGTKLNQVMPFESRGTDFDDALEMPQMREFLLKISYDPPAGMWEDIPIVSAEEFFSDGSEDYPIEEAV
jgi:uncharacterized phage-associated protein